MKQRLFNMKWDRGVSQQRGLPTVAVTSSFLPSLVGIIIFLLLLPTTLLHFKHLSFSKTEH